MERQPLESDWKVYRKRVSEWRERYVAKKNQEIIGLLTDEGKTPTEQFWEAKRQIEEEARVLADCLDNHSRSKMQWNLFLMHRHGLVGDEDLEEFGAELRDRVLWSSREVIG